MTYAELDALSDRFAAGLRGDGVRPGDAVGLQLPNLPHFLIAYFGILKNGSIVVPLNVLLKAPEVEYHLSDSEATGLITWAGLLAEAGKGAASAGIDRVYVVDRSGLGEPSIGQPFERACSRSPPVRHPSNRPIRATRRPSSTPRGRRGGPRARSSPTSS
jgi:long-chain acyl-CoA synthetase